MAEIPGPPDPDKGLPNSEEKEQSVVELDFGSTFKINPGETVMFGRSPLDAKISLDLIKAADSIVRPTADARYNWLSKVCLSIKQNDDDGGITITSLSQNNTIFVFKPNLDNQRHNNWVELTNILPKVKIADQMTQELAIAIVAEDDEGKHRFLVLGTPDYFDHMNKKDKSSPYPLELRGQLPDNPVLGQRESRQAEFERLTGLELPRITD